MFDGETLTGPPPGDAPGVGPLTLGTFIVDRGTRFGPREALVFDDPLQDEATVRWTYGDLLARARSVAKSLLALGLGKGARVGILMGNRPEAVASVFGAALAGVVAVPLSTFAPKPELAHLLADADISVLLLQSTMGDRRFADDVAELCPSATGLAPFGDPRFPFLCHAAVVGPAREAADIAPWDRLLARGEAVVSDDVLDAVVDRVHPSDLALAIYSSGTTGRPKGVLLTHDAVARQFWMQAQLFGRDGTTRLWCSLPLFWTAGIGTAMGATLAAGGTWIMQERFDAGRALALIQREHVTEPHTLPHQARALAAHPSWASSDLSSCTKVYGKSVFTRHPSVTGDTSWTMPVGYGLSETSSFFTGTPCDAPREVLRNGSYGRLLPGNQLRVIDPDTGDVLGVDQQGELAVRGPTLMDRYVAQTRAACFDADGFFRTGDLGWFDEDGFVHFAGRRTDMIKTAGANVSPTEIEVQLQAHPAVRVARVVGVPDEARDEIAVLCVEPADGDPPSAHDLTSFLAERLAGYKVPRHVLFFAEDELPMNATGTKVKDDTLVAIVMERLHEGAR